MKLKYTIISIILIFIIFSIKVYSNTPPNFINEFVVTDTSMKFYLPTKTYLYNDKLFIFVDNHRSKVYEYSIMGNLLGINEFPNNIYRINKVSYTNDTLKINILQNTSDTLRYFSFTYSNNLKDLNEVKKIFFYGSVTLSNMLFVPKNDSIYAFLASYDILDNKTRYYKYIVMDTNYTIARYIDIESDSIDSDMTNGYTPSYILDNGHHLVTLDKIINHSSIESDRYFYEFDFEGKYYSKKLQDNKIVYNGDTLVNEPQASTKKDFGEEVNYSKLTNGSKNINVLIKYARNGDIKWIKPLDDYPNILPDRMRVTYLFNKQIIAISGRYFKDGIFTNPKGSFLELYDNDGNKLESYFWHRNPTLDCTILGINEGPNGHILLFTKNGSDSLLVSEMVPKYLGVKDKKITKSSIKTFPNPASSTTTIKLSEELNGKISAVDLLGNETLVWSGFAPVGDLELDVSHLPAGIYTILINNGYKTETLKMIKE